MISTGFNVINSRYDTRQRPLSTFRLQKIFFSAYFPALFSDWLKGAYIYKLYSWYGYEEADIAILYVTGFLSSAVFGTFSGSLTDRFGRR